MLPGASESRRCHCRDHIVLLCPSPQDASRAHNLPPLPHRVGPSHNLLAVTSYNIKPYDDPIAFSQAGRRRFESDRPLFKKRRLPVTVVARRRLFCAVSKTYGNPLTVGSGRIHASFCQDLPTDPSTRLSSVQGFVQAPEITCKLSYKDSSLAGRASGGLVGREGRKRVDGSAHVQ